MIDYGCRGVVIVIGKLCYRYMRMERGYCRQVPATPDYVE